MPLYEYLPLHEEFPAQERPEGADKIGRMAEQPCLLLTHRGMFRIIPTGNIDIQISGIPGEPNTG